MAALTADSGDAEVVRQHEMMFGRVGFESSAETNGDCASATTTTQKLNQQERTVMADS